ncbi:putative roundabout 3-like, partial [Homarus americanus]
MSGEASTVEGFYIRLHHVSRDHHPSPAQVTAAGVKPRIKGLPPPLLSQAGNSTVVTVLNAGPGASSYVLHGLYHYRTYTVFLVPFFKTFEGHPSNSRTFETPEAAGGGVMTSGVPLSVNGSVTSLKVHNLTLGNSYHLTLAASTAGRGPYTSPVSLHVDPVLLHPLAKSGPSLASLDGDVWVIGLIGAAVCLLLVSIATLLLWRRHARNKALGHVGVSVHKVDNLGVGLAAGDSGLWQEYAGWQLEKVCGGGASGLVGGGGGLVGGGGGGGGGGWQFLGGKCDAGVCGTVSCFCFLFFTLSLHFKIS